MSKKTAEVIQENIIRTDYSEIMQKSYIDYAMSVIISRALPDVRDGLKPVQRRTLYDMNELGIRYDRPYRKCARIVGDTMGKYHPHGDSSIYEALVVMAQDFKKGQVLVDGHGNFGSIEGDGAAAMRYTEARLEKITQEVFLADLDKDVVDFKPNFDETEKEPCVLPVRIPNLLINGAEGIAVGMATSIPPHNLGEIIGAMKAYIKNKDISTKELMKYVKGPDFPTGGIITNRDELLEIYEKGTGKIKIRGKVETEKGKNGKTLVVISEIPYTMIGAKIGKFLNDIAMLAESKKTTDIADISNQSSKDGMRIVIELKKGADAENFINLLYKKTKLEDTFGVNMLAVCSGRPETMSLKRILEEQVDFRFEIANRKFTTLLKEETAKSEIQEGLIEACNVIDVIIEVLRGSKNQKMAKDCLISGCIDNIKFRTKDAQKKAAKFRFTEKQADAILNMRLVKLIGLEVEALVAEHEKTLKNIEYYNRLLSDYDSMANYIIEDLDDIKKHYAKPRKTQVTVASEAVYVEEEKEACLVYFCMDRFGYAKTMDMSLYEKNMETVITESRFSFPVMSDGRICIFTDTGKMHQIKVSDIPNCKMKDKGIPADNISNYKSSDEKIIYICGFDELMLSRLAVVTGQGLVKIFDASELKTNNRTVAATKLSDGDEVIFIGRADEMNYICLKSEQGFIIKFAKNEIPEQKKTAFGVRGMKLEGNDRVSEAYLIEGGSDFVLQSEEKKIFLNRLKTSKRGGKGTKKF
ncbi:MAG: DNA gyrase/topoisomerase IV subunit A [Lachnospiraceae bacterium]|jgi:DNA gyrase subunit A